MRRLGVLIFSLVLFGIVSTHISVAQYVEPTRTCGQLAYAWGPRRESRVLFYNNTYTVLFSPKRIGNHKIETYQKYGTSGGFKIDTYWRYAGQGWNFWPGGGSIGDGRTKTINLWTGGTNVEYKFVYTYQLRYSSNVLSYKLYCDGRP